MPLLWQKINVQGKISFQGCERLHLPFIHLGNSPQGLPLFRHSSREFLVVLVPDGCCKVGLGEEERIAAEALFPGIDLPIERLRPVHEFSTRSFLVSQYPVLAGQFEEFPVPMPRKIPQELEWMKSMVPAHAKPARARKEPLRIAFDNASAFTATLGARLITEHEWEYCCRAGSQSLFYFGNSIPQDIEGYVSDDFSVQRRCNSFGLYGLFAGEFCSDFYRDNYYSSSVGCSDTVIRGGGSQFWPWQTGYEWMWCMSSMRVPSRELLFGQAAFRLVWDVPE